MLFPGGREAIKLGLAIRIRHAPFFVEKAFAFETMQRRIQRAFLHCEFFARALSNPAPNCVAMQRPPRERFQNDEIERACVQVRSGQSGKARWEARWQSVSILK